MSSLTMIHVFTLSFFVNWLAIPAIGEKVCQKAEHVTLLFLFDMTRPLNDPRNIYRPALQWLMDATEWERLNLVS